MVRVHLKGVNSVTKTLADGTRKKYYYHRATGFPLNGKPDSSEFIESYALAEKALSERNRDTFSALVRFFILSPEFGKKAKSTQTEYKRILTRAEEKFCTLPLSALEDPRIRRDFMQWRAEVVINSGEREGDNRLSVISSMLTWAIENGHVFSNHVKGFIRLYVSNRSEIIWLEEHIHVFMEKAPIEIQRALILALHTGQRQGDLLKLKRTQYNGTHILLRQGKSKRNGSSGNLVYVKCTSALRNMLDNMNYTSEFILTTKTGVPFKKRHFCKLWAEVSKEAGLDAVWFDGLDKPQKLHFHDLRGTAVTMLAAAGNDIPAIAAITGHSLKTAHSILEKYLARTKQLADSAIDRFEASEKTHFANQRPVQEKRRS